MLENIDWNLTTGIIGAAAWSVPIVSWLKGLLQRPKVTMIASRTCQIGFTEFGPVLNVKVAITANSDVLITNFKLHIVHESGAKHELRWHEVVEVKGQLIGPGVQSQPIFQETEAIAMKILATDFKDVELKNRMSTHMDTYTKMLREWRLARMRLEKAGQYDPGTFYASNLTHGIVSYLRSQMIWKSGRYSVHFNVEAKETVTFEAPVLEFDLSQEDIDQLQENNDTIPKWMSNNCFFGHGDTAPMVQLNWHWLFPALIRRP